MTRTLVIVRHAEAVSPEGFADVDRPLTRRGHADAAAAGSWLAEHGYRPAVVLCSPSLRTRQTWHGIAAALLTEPLLRFETAIYSSTPEGLLALVRQLDDDVATAMVIGHNPGVSQLVAGLDPDWADGDGLSTASIAVHSCAGPWAECGRRRAALVATHTVRAVT